MWEMNNSACGFLADIARSLGSSSIEDLAKELGFESAQDMADKNGFVNILAYFSAPGSFERFLGLEIALIEKRKK